MISSWLTASQVEVVVKEKKKKKKNWQYRRCRQWQPSPVLLPGKSHGQRSLVCQCLWGHIQSNTTEQLHFHFSLFTFHALEKEMATHSSVLAWRIPGMAEPDGLLSVGSHRVGHDWSTLAAARERGTGLIPGLGRAPGGGNGNPLHNSCLENSKDRGAWSTTVHRVAES